MDAFSKNITGWERASFEKSLCCLLKELGGIYTTIELKNEIQIKGKVDHIDGFMNVSMSDVFYEKPYSARLHFTNIKIHGKQIRFVHIPDQINIQKAITNQLDKNRHDNKKYGTKSRQSYTERKRKERLQIIQKLENTS